MQQSTCAEASARQGLRLRRVAGLLAVAAITWTAVAMLCSAASGHTLSGANLLQNSTGGVGAISAQGWDSVTIPGWQVREGLPTVVHYGRPGFPRGGAPGKRLFAGGPGGSALLEQQVSLQPPAGTRLTQRTRFRLSAWLGGTETSAASLKAVFRSASGRALAVATTGPVGENSEPRRGFRSASGVIPRGAVAADVVLRLATTLRNFDGPWAPRNGYNRAVAGGLRFGVTPPLVRQPLKPPVARVPRFDHVFLFMFENEDYRAVIGNRRQAPYLNSLMARGSSLANMFAEEHPSDGNYLALAAGGVFGIPLTDPLEINPRFTVRTRQIGDLVDAAHETWKAYLQSAAGPCDDTVHGYYWNDDLPFLYFPQVRDRPAYCSSHDVPLSALEPDLAKASTTPNFVWVGADDCSDMEGCGIRTGDHFLARTLRKILASPAWRTQRSLAIVTFDEDGYDHEHPPQRIPTIMLGSRGVRAGFVSHRRYTHYSLLRTIEAALRLGPLTKNDLYARPVNDVFTERPNAAARPRRRDVRRLANHRLSAAKPHGDFFEHPLANVFGGWSVAAMGRPRRGSRPSARRSATAFVANYGSANVTPVSLATGKAGRAIQVGSRPAAIAVTPNGRTAYAVNSGSATVTPITTRTKKAGRPIRVGSGPRAIAITPDGRRAYIVNAGSDSVTPIDTTSNRALRAIRVGSDPRSIAITPDGRTAFVLDWGGASVTPIDLATDRARAPIPLGSYPSAITIAPDGATAYVASYGANTVTPIDVAHLRRSRPIPVGQAPNALAISSDGSTLEVVSGDTDSVIQIRTATRRATAPIRVGYSPEAVVVSHRIAWVTNTISGTVTPVNIRTRRAGHPVSVGVYAYPTAITLITGTAKAIVVGTYGGKVSLLDTRTRRTQATTRVGRYPVAVAVDAK
ncbi:MAG: alkaline phosphatase family protein [Solirubrobacteraceae bacterium]